MWHRPGSNRKRHIEIFEVQNTVSGKCKAYIRIGYPGGVFKVNDCNLKHSHPIYKIVGRAGLAAIVEWNKIDEALVKALWGVGNHLYKLTISSSYWKTSGLPIYLLRKSKVIWKTLPGHIQLEHRMNIFRIFSCGTIGIERLGIRIYGKCYFILWG